MRILPAGVSSTDVMKCMAIARKYLNNLFVHLQLSSSSETLRPSGCVDLEYGTTASIANRVLQH